MSDYSYIALHIMHVFKNLGQLLNCKRNVRLKIVASGCDQCVWPVGVVAGCGHW